MAIRYTGDLGCRYRGVPHDMRIIKENPRVKWEVCQICNKKKRYNKGYLSRVNNVEYLRDHVRNFAQPHGATRAVFERIYRSETYKIVL